MKAGVDETHHKFTPIRMLLLRACLGLIEASSSERIRLFQQAAELMPPHQHTMTWIRQVTSVWDNVER